LHSIVAWLDLHSTKAGNEFVNSVFASLGDLARTPGLASPKQFRNRKLKGMRTWSVPGFRKFLIFYRVLSDAIEVIAIVHGSRELRSLLRKRL
jgi:toxin ParE1/3/4